MTGFDTITFLSDYGLEDEYVGVVKSVMRTICPSVTVIDLTHAIAPYDVRGGGLALARSVEYLVPGVVLAIVDPGVGTQRRGIAVEVGGGQSVLVGPDNGVLAPAVAMCGGATSVVELTNEKYRLESPGSTFDGRDIFGPAAAHLASGVPTTELGNTVDPASLFPGVMPLTRVEGDQMLAQVLRVDRFGNVQLNVDPDEIDSHGSHLTVRIGETTMTLRRVQAFADLTEGDVGVLIDSSGLVSFAMDRSSAALELGVVEGDAVSIAVPMGGSISGSRESSMGAGDEVSMSTTDAQAAKSSPVELRARSRDIDVASPGTKEA